MLPSVLLPIGLAVIGALARNATNTTSLIEELVVAPDHVDRVADLPYDSEFVFDFFNPPTAGVVPGAAGHLVLASVSDFPALVGNGVALLAGFLGPCGMNTPHTHPRATEFLYLVNGTLQNGMITETGSRFIVNNITGGQGILLPQGSIHFQFNDNCEPIQFVSALNSEDPGTLLASQGLFGLPPAIVAATLGQIGVEEVISLAQKIPDDVAFGSQECLTRCGISVGAQPTNEQVPRVSGNAFPSTFTSSRTTTATVTSTQGPTTDTQNQSREVNDDFFADNIIQPGGSMSSPKNAGEKSAVTALTILVALMGAGYVGLAVLFCLYRRRSARIGKDTWNPQWVSSMTETAALNSNLDKYDGGE